jgi:hypothetical protein
MQSYYLPTGRCKTEASQSSEGSHPRTVTETGTPPVILDHAHGRADYGELMPKAAPFRKAVRRVNPSPCVAARKQSSDKSTDPDSALVDDSHRPVDDRFSWSTHWLMTSSSARRLPGGTSRARSGSPSPWGPDPRRCPCEPTDRAVLVWRADHRSLVERFIDGDPYVHNGLVTSWTIRRWTVLIGEGAGQS